MYISLLGLTVVHGWASHMLPWYGRVAWPNV